MKVLICWKFMKTSFDVSLELWSYSRHIPIPKIPSLPASIFSCVQRVCSKLWILTPEPGNRQSHGFLETKNATVQLELAPMWRIGLAFSLLTLQYLCHSQQEMLHTFYRVQVASMWKTSVGNLSLFDGFSLQSGNLTTFLGVHNSLFWNW